MMNLFRLIISYLFLQPVLISGLLSANFSWEVITNFNDAKEIHISNDTLYAATTGGLVIVSLENNDSKTLTSQDGLTDHNFRNLFESDKGIIIAGTLNGVLGFYQKKTGKYYQDYNLSGNQIISIHAVEDTLWIAAKKMIAVYLYNREQKEYQFRDFFTNFGRDFEQFYFLTYHDRKIWAASDNGLFHASANFLRFNLKSASNWKVLTSDDGLPHNNIYSLATKEDTLLIGTRFGLSKYSRQNYSNITAGLNNQSIRHIKLHRGNIWVDNSKYIYRLDGSIFTPQYFASVDRINDFVLDSEDNIWVSLIEKGLRSSPEGRKIWFNGPVDNALGEIILDRQGRLWVVSGSFKDERARGFSVRTADGIWQNYRHLGGWRSTASAQTIMEDDGGNIWIGSWNGGLLIIDPELNIYHFNNYTEPGQIWISSVSRDDTVDYNPPDSVRHFLSYTKSFPNLLVVTDIIRDPFRESIWLSLYSVNSTQPIVRYADSEFNSLAYDSSAWERRALNINTDEVASLTLDIFNNLWIGTERFGVLGMQITETGGINWEHIDETDNLKNNRVLAIAGDQDGFVWLGTNSGLNAYFNGNLFDFREDYQPIGLRINKIFVDNQNNKWFATNRGLSLLLAKGSPWDPESWVHFVPNTSELFGPNITHSNLPDEDVRSVYVDDRTGDVYCGTFSGLAILRNNPYTTPLTELDQVKVGPSPLVIEEGNQNFVYFRNLTGNSEIKILTANGRLVRILDQSDSDDFLGSFAQWNCRNQDGRLVSSGIYLYLITDEIGNATSGKFLIIRE